MYCKVDSFLKEYLFGRVVDKGDPISVYLFDCSRSNGTNKFNKDIKGTTIESHEFKLTQFADDTILFLNESTASLQAALNTLGIFGNFSGLKMNKEFSVDIPKIPELNFNKAYHSIMTEMKKWEYHNLPIIGKVTVIKTFLLSKLVHLLTSLPVSEDFLKSIIDCFFLNFYGIGNLTR